MDQHLDAERLAAFMDGSLSRADRQAVEAHASDCAVCLQLLAAMARTEPVAEPTGWRLPWAWRWAVPLAAAATAVALWINVERGVPTPQQVLQDRAAPAAAPAEPPAAGTETPAPPPAIASPEVRDQAPAANRERQLSARQDALAETEKQEKAATPPVERRAAAPVPPAAAGEATDAFVGRPESAGARLAAIATEIVSPDPLRRWRVVRGAVQGSVDGGKTWTTPPAGVEGELVAGSAPAPTVAWLVGRAGLVVLTTDGVTWQRVAFPEAVDLVAVRARNEREVDVTAADGRTFRTVDGGKTWERTEEKEEG